MGVLSGRFSLFVDNTAINEEGIQYYKYLLLKQESYLSSANKLLSGPENSKIFKYLNDSDKIIRILVPVFRYVDPHLSKSVASVLEEQRKERQKLFSFIF